jgi:hypothetical protein
MRLSEKSGRDVDLPDLATNEIIEFSLRHVGLDLLIESNHQAERNTDPDDDYERCVHSVSKVLPLCIHERQVTPMETRNCSLLPSKSSPFLAFEQSG